LIKNAVRDWQRKFIPKNISKKITQKLANVIKKKLKKFGQSDLNNLVEKKFPKRKTIKKLRKK